MGTGGSPRDTGLVLTAADIKGSSRDGALVSRKGDEWKLRG
jgi:hypothetical protein